MTNKLLRAALLLTILLATYGCTSPEGEDMLSSEAAERLKDESGRLAARLGDPAPTMTKGEYLTCEPQVYDGNVYFTWTSRAALTDDAVRTLEEEVVPAMEDEGWTLRRTDSEDYVAFDFDKDGFVVGATVPTREGGSGISVGGSSPCVEDDGTTGIVHDEQ